MTQKVKVFVKSDVIEKEYTQTFNETPGELLRAIQVVGQATNELLTTMIEAQGIDSAVESGEDDDEEDGAENI